MPCWHLGTMYARCIVTTLGHDALACWNNVRIVARILALLCRRTGVLLGHYCGRPHWARPHFATAVITCCPVVCNLKCPLTHQNSANSLGCCSALKGNKYCGHCYKVSPILYQICQHCASILKRGSGVSAPVCCCCAFGWTDVVSWSTHIIWAQ